MAMLSFHIDEVNRMNKKNLLFVFADQWRRSSLGIYRDDPVITPNMDEFAQSGVICTDAVSSCPLCSPARASLMTGLYPLHTGVFTNCKNASDIRLRDDDLCIGQVLSDNGYDTGYIGKWHLDEPEQNHDPSPTSGASAWDAYTPPGIRRHGFGFWHAYNACDKHLSPHYWENSPEMITSDKWSPIHETDVAIEYIEGRDGKRPFALFVSWNPPHSPYDTAPEEYKKLYRDSSYIRGNVDMSRLQETMHHTFEPFPLTENGIIKLGQDYFAAISGLDDQFGRLIDCLKKKGIYDDTIVVLTADHGDMLGSHTLIGKHVWYEESIGIPFVIGGGGLEHGYCGTVFGSQDVPSTILSLLDIEIPSCWEGHSISDDILNHRTTDGSCSFIAACPGRDIFIEDFRKHGLDIMSYGWRAVRDQRYTYVISVGYRIVPEVEFFLYDNVSDPLQLAPLVGEAAENSPEGKRLGAMLMDWLYAQNDSFVNNLRS